MADTLEFFTNYLPNKIATQPSMVEEVNAVYLFNIQGAGTWTVDLTGDGSVTEGGHDDPGCVISTDKESWETMLDNPGKAMMLFTMGKLRASNLGLAMKLQKILA